MAQIIKHRRGSLEALSAVTASLQKGELVIASGSSNLTVTNGSSLVFTVPADGQVQATNRFLIGDSAPNTFAGSTYNGMMKGVPYYASGSSTLYLLGTDGNDAINLVGNIQPFSSSVATSINALSASIGGGSIGTAVNALNVFTGSQESKNATLEEYTSSVDGHISDINAYTASNNTTNTAQSGRLDNLEATSASVNTSITSINTSLSTQDTKNSTLATYTASVDSTLSDIADEQSTQDGRLDDLEGFQSDIETAISVDGTNVTIAGNLTVAGTQTIVDSTTVQIGDNIIELNGSGAANGGLWVKDATAPNTNTGSIVWDTTNDYWKAGVKGSEIKVLLAGGDGVVSGSSQIDHNSTTNYQGDEHINHKNVSILGGDGMTGGGDITSTRTLTLDTSSAHFTSGVKTQLDSNTVVSGSSQITISDTTGYSTFSSSIATNVVELFTTASDHESRIDVIEASVGGGGSVATRIDQLAAATASVNSFTSSTLGHISDINAYTTSVNGHISDINTWSGSAKTSISDLETKAGTLATYTASVNGHISDINAYTASNNTTNTAQNSRLTNIESFTSSFGTTFSSSVDSRLDTLEGTGTIQGLGTGNNVTFAKVTTTGDVVIGGDLVVQGNTVTLNTAQLVVEDKLITLASGSTSNATADGAGFEIAGTSASFKYDGVENKFSSSVEILANVTGSINLPTGGSSKRIAFRTETGNLDLVDAPVTSGDILQWNGTDFVMSNTIDGGSF